MPAGEGRIEEDEAMAGTDRLGPDIGVVGIAVGDDRTMPATRSS